MLDFPKQGRGLPIAAAVLNAVPFPIPLGYAGLGLKASTLIGTIMRVASPIVGFFFALMVMGVVQLITGDDACVICLVSDESNKNGKAADTLFAILVMTPAVIFLVLSAWDAWRIAKGRKGMFEARHQPSLGIQEYNSQFSRREQRDSTHFNSVSSRQTLGKVKTWLLIAVASVPAGFFTYWYLFVL